MDTQDHTENAQTVENTPTVENTETVDAQEFMDKTNSTQKKLGHNKLQFQIDDLQNQLQRSQAECSEKELKLNLFKKTISTLQSQLADKENTINQLTQQVEQLTSKLDATPVPQTIDTEDQPSQNTDNLQKQLHDQSIVIEDLKTQLQAKDNQIQTNQTELQTIKVSFEDQTRALLQAKETIDSMDNQVGVHKSTAEKTQEELDDVKRELVDYRQNIEALKQSLEDQRLKLEEATRELQIQLSQPTPQAPSQSTQPPNVVRGAVRVKRSQIKLSQPQ